MAKSIRNVISSSLALLRHWETTERDYQAILMNSRIFSTILWAPFWAKVYIDAEGSFTAERYAQICRARLLEQGANMTDASSLETVPQGQVIRNSTTGIYRNA